MGPGRDRKHAYKQIVQPTVLQAKSHSDVMFCLQSIKGLRIERSLVY